MQMIVCDECKVAKPFIGAVDWVETDCVGGNARTFSDLPLKGEKGRLDGKKWTALARDLELATRRCSR
jgi:hypothetical protein